MHIFKVKEVDDQGDRIILYGEDYQNGYHVIADTDCPARSGDTVAYEPVGYNFGFFMKVLND